MPQKINQNYQRFSKLSQELFFFICLVAKKESEIRSVTIIKFLGSMLKIEVTMSWINQIIRREEIKRPQGRPSKQYIMKEKNEYFLKIEVIYQETIDKMGILLIQDIMKYYKLNDLFVDLLKKAQKEIDTNRFKQKTEKLENFIDTMTAISLDPSVNNFEEAINADISHCPMSCAQARDLVKNLEKSKMIINQTMESFVDYWIKFIETNENKEIQFIIYIDGHIKPYFSKETHVCGKISASEKVMPGTKYVIATCSNGYVLDIRNIEVDMPYGEKVIEMIKYLSIKLENRIKLVIMDREGCGKELNNKIDSDFKIKTLTPLRSNQYKSLEDFTCEKIGDNLYKGNWKDSKKLEEDSRNLIIIDYIERLCVFATTDEEIGIETQKTYKTRWPNNEEIIKYLNMITGFNTNISNGIESIPNPKKTREIEELGKKIKSSENKIKNYKEAKINLINNSEIKRYDKQIMNANNKIKNYKEKIKKTGEINPVKIRKTEPDNFIAFLKAGILNLFRFILIKCLELDTEKNKPPVEKMWQMLINRKGKIIENYYEKVYIFDTPSTVENIKLLTMFCNNFNKLNITTYNGKNIILKFNSS